MTSSKKTKRKNRQANLHYAIAITAVAAAIAVQTANVGYQYLVKLDFSSSTAEPSLSTATVNVDDTDYGKMLQEVKSDIAARRFDVADINLQKLADTRNDKVLLEVAKQRIRRETPLYSYKIASEILLSLIDVKPLRGEAAFLLARYHMQSIDQVSREKAAALLQQSIEWGFEKSHGSLGDIYSRGIGAPKKYVVALKHYEDAAESFSAAPIVAFARRIASLKAHEPDCGIRADRIIKRHLPSLQIEARAGKVGAAKELGRVFFKGKLVDRDLSEARKWLELAADSGNSGAMRDLAILEMKHPNESGSMKLAISLLEKSAKAGNAAAYTSLGRIYLKEKTPKMEQKAIEAFEVAAKSGHRPALKELAVLEEKYAEAAGIDFVVTGSTTPASNTDSQVQNLPQTSQDMLASATWEFSDNGDVCEVPEELDLTGIAGYFD